jgi:outer membrane receptor protein involved in Fe transport
MALTSSTAASVLALAAAAMPTAAAAQTEEQQVEAEEQVAEAPPPGDPQEESIVVTGGVNYISNHKLDFTVGVGEITTLRGGIGYSKHQATTNLTYKNEGFAWQWQAQYFGPALNDPDASENTYDIPRVDDVVFFNTSMSYNINDRRVSLVVDNVFDTRQPFPVPANGGSVTYFDGIRGRYFRFGAGVKF